MGIGWSGLTRSASHAQVVLDRLSMIQEDSSTYESQLDVGQLELLQLLEKPLARIGEGMGPRIQQSICYMNEYGKILI